MSAHPVTSWAFDDLARELNARVDAKLVRVVACPEDPEIRLYSYTQSAMFDKQWDDVTLLARGLVLHHGRREVLARPFPKFFNHGERTFALPDEPFRVYEKLDGSLGVVFHNGVRWCVATRGSWTSTQAAWAQSWLDARDLSPLSGGATYLFEIVYAANRIVIRYPFEGLVLLAAYSEAGTEIAHPEIERLAAALGTRAAQCFEYPSVDHVVTVAASLTSQQEGFVVRFASGYRVKIKGADYLRVHRLVSNTTPLALWDAMRNGDDLDKLRREIPEEFGADFDAIRASLQAQFDMLVCATETERRAWDGKTNKDIGLALDTIAQPARSFIFASRRGPEWTRDTKTRASIFQSIRPTGNVLVGYSPSAAITHAQDGDA